MTMYLPNSGLQPTGSENTEFIDAPPMSEIPSEADGPVEPRDGATVGLDAPTRLTIARWAEEFISGLVENHNGDPADVRFVIDELRHRRAAGRWPEARSM